MNKTTYFPAHIQKLGEEKELSAILLDIRNGSYKDTIDIIRAARDSGDEAKVSRFKAQLPCFTPSGTFKGGRTLRHLSVYNQLIVLDVDKLEDAKLEKVRNLAMACEYTMVCFTSPSGKGLKILIKTNAESNTHKECFDELANYYKNTLGVPIDKSGSDVPRLCYVSYDPDLYENNDAKVWEYPLSDMSTMESRYNAMVFLTSNRVRFETGSRNKFIYQLACNLNREGMPEEEALRLTIERYQSVDFTDSEIQVTIASGYKNVSEFGNGNYGNYGNGNYGNSHIQEETPLVTARVIDQLPDFLKKIVSHFDNDREKDVVLLSTLAVMSAIFPSVCGTYDSKRTHSNLYLLITAPPASGKGVMQFAEKLVRLINEEWLRDSNMAIEKHKIAHMDVKNPPPPPLRRMLVLSPNNSESNMISTLSASGGVGILFSTEADYASKQFSREWSNNSEILRSAFHHEKITYSRKTNQEYVEVEYPKLSIVYSGTFDQIPKLISSVENGLFSRFLQYSFKRRTPWKNVFAESVPLDNIFETTYAKEVYDMHSFYKDSEVKFYLKKSQEDKFNELAGEIDGQASADEVASVRRIYLMGFRIAMVLTCVRNYVPGAEVPTTLECSDDDFETSMTLVDQLIEHSSNIFSHLPKKRVQEAEVSAGAMNLLSRFQCGIITKRADIEKTAGIPPRTMSYNLKTLVKKGYLIQLDRGTYQRQNCE